MLDDWEWDDTLLNNIPNLDQLKKIQERKLVEESDNAIIDELFLENCNKNEKKTSQFVSSNLYMNLNKKIMNGDKINKKELNEKKQKIKSIKLKEAKLKKQREFELFGDVEEDKYSIYEDIIYKM